VIIVGLVILGLAFGSFVNALVWRIYKQENAKSKNSRQKYSISKGRSMCPHCGHRLAAKDLVPVISWLSLRGKCRYCHKPISRQYPLVELSTALLFVGSYLFWPEDLAAPVNLVIFITWLISLTGLAALFVYDVKYMLLPNKIVFPLMAVAGAGVLVKALLLGSVAPLTAGFFGLLVGGGIFYVLFQVSSGKWIGGGDVKLGFALGILVGGPLMAFIMLLLASLLGSVFSLPLMLRKRLHAKSKIPFGPFLIAGTLITKLFGATVIDLYTNLLI